MALAAFGAVSQFKNWEINNVRGYRLDDEYGLVALQSLVPP